MKTYRYYPTVESKVKTRCSFCGVQSDYRTFREVEEHLKDGNILYIKVCRQCYSRMVYNPPYRKKVIAETKTYIGL